MSPTDWPPSLSEAQRSELTTLATTYAIAKGLTYLPLPNVSSPFSPPTLGIHAPLTLFPTQYPRDQFTKARKLQRAYNVLYARVAMDTAFLDRIMGATEGVGRVDEFVGSLWKGWKAIRDMDDNATKRLYLGLFRSDYLLHQPNGSSSKAVIKQVEFNTISSSFGPLCDRTAALHRYLFHVTGYYSATSHLNDANFPSNDSLAGLVEGLVAAHKAYGSPSASILFVVQPGERNIFDQRWLEYELTERHSIRVIRQTFQQLATSAVVSASGLLTIANSVQSEPGSEISVIYYRAGYGPKDYPTQQDFDVRFRLEASKAINCPSIPLQLAGGKKIQQVLSKPGVLESFLQDTQRWGHGTAFSDADLAELRETWMGMWCLDEVDGVDRARAASGHLVLKPQREGGGNNVYKGAIPPLLDSLPEKEKQTWIAMELIQYPEGQRNWLSKAGEGSASEKEVASELGIFGWALYGGDDGKSILREKEVGWLLRTKGVESDEGGVAVGYSVLDSVVLV